MTATERLGTKAHTRPFSFESGSINVIRTRTRHTNPTILVVEDEMLLRLDLAHQLRSAGFDVIVADSGDEAVANY